MKLREVTLRVPRGQGDVVTALLDVENIAAIEASGSTDVVRLWIDSADEEHFTDIEARFAAWTELAAPGVECSVSARFVEPSTDASADDTGWSRSFPGFRVGRICILPEDNAAHARLRDDDIPLPITAGAAFGTGRHPTTRTCLRHLQPLVRPDDVVLDAGCGTGILGVATLLLGARSAHFVDNDPDCLTASRDLAALAPTATSTFDLAAVPLDAAATWSVPDSHYTGLIANIEHDVIRAGAPALARTLAPGGWFVISGCRVREPDDIVPALEAAGLRVERVVAAGARFRAYVGLLPTTSTPAPLA